MQITFCHCGVRFRLQEAAIFCLQSGPNGLKTIICSFKKLMQTLARPRRPQRCL